MGRRISLEEWRGRYGTPQLHDAFRDDPGPRRDWSTGSIFAIESATPAEAERAGIARPRFGARLAKLVRLEGTRPTRLCVLVFLIRGEDVPLLNAAGDDALKTVWDGLLADGNRVFVVTLP